MNGLFTPPPAEPADRWTRVYPDGVRVLVLAEVQYRQPHDRAFDRKLRVTRPADRVVGHWLHSGEFYTCKLEHLLKHFERVKCGGGHLPAGLVVVQRAIDKAAEREEAQGA